MNNEKPLVIYHADCTDGFAAALILWDKNPDWEFHPAQYHEPPPDCTGREVYMVDFAYPRAVVERIARVADGVTILDHHETAYNDLQGIEATGLDVMYVYDPNRCGAMLTWRFVHGRRASPPDWLRYVQDRDLWTKKYGVETAIMACYLSSLKHDFELWRDRVLNGDTRDMIEEGWPILRYVQRRIDVMIADWHRHPSFVTIGKIKAPAANAPGIFASDLGNALCDGHPFAAVWQSVKPGVVKYSLRTRNGLNVADIAALYGGGGHPAAAGFVLGTPLEVEEA